MNICGAFLTEVDETASTILVQIDDTVVALGILRSELP